MQGLDPNAIAGLPFSMQIVVYAALFAGVLLASAFAYLRTYRKADPQVDPRKAANDLLLTAGTIADMGPVRKAEEHLGRLTEIAEQMLEEQRRNRHVMERISECMAESAAFERGLSAGRARRD